MTAAEHKCLKEKEWGEITTKIDGIFGSIKELKRQGEQINPLTESIATMTERIGNLVDSTNEVKQKVDDLRTKPIKDWNSIKITVIGGIIIFAVTFLVTKFL